MSARDQCYKEIRSVMAEEIGAFYTLNPDKFGDERSRVAIDRSLIGLKNILSVLDKYDISIPSPSEKGFDKTHPNTAKPTDPIYDSRNSDERI